MMNDHLYEFLARHKLSIDDVFFADGLRPSQFKPLIREENCVVAVDVAPCRNFGHTIYTRSGDCAECNSAKIAFVKRHRSSGEIYLAFSADGGVCKVGLGRDVGRRLVTLNCLAYGGFNDWVLKRSWHSAEAGRTEAAIHKLLSEYRVSGMRPAISY